MKAFVPLVFLACLFVTSAPSSTDPPAPPGTDPPAPPGTDPPAPPGTDPPAPPGTDPPAPPGTDPPAPPGTDPPRPPGTDPPVPPGTDPPAPPGTDPPAPPGTDPPRPPGTDPPVPPGTDPPAPPGTDPPAPPGTDPPAPPGTDPPAPPGTDPPAPPGTDPPAPPGTDPPAPPGTDPPRPPGTDPPAPPGTDPPRPPGTDPPAPPGTDPPAPPGTDPPAPPGTDPPAPPGTDPPAPPGTDPPAPPGTDPPAPPGTDPPAPPGTDPPRPPGTDPPAPPGTDPPAPPGTDPPRPPGTDPPAPPGTDPPAPPGTDPPAPPGTDPPRPPGTNPPGPSSTTQIPPDNTDPCETKSCVGGSSCVRLKNESFCLCVEGYYYNKNSMCDRGKLFPGSVQTPEVKNWNDKTSEDYQNLHFTITNFFANTFKNTDYGQTVITKVSSLSEARYGIRTGASNLKVSVVNIFAETTTQNETTVYNIIKNSMANSNIANYDSQSLCDYYGCVKNKDNCNNGLQCQCQDGLERPNPQVPFCVATVPAVCSSGCSSKYHKQCIIKSNTAECMCLAGYERDGRGDCQKCATGYSGVNCQDSFQMILIIVGSIAAIIIIGMAIALIVLRTKSKKNNIEEQNLIENDFQNLRLQQTTGFSNPGAEGSLFPKIRANTTSQPQNPYTNQSRLPYPDY